MRDETDEQPGHGTTVDAKVAAIIDRRTDKGLKKDSDEDDDDALFDELERDDDGALDGLRERRMQQLHDEFARERQMKELNQGVYTEYSDEKQLMTLTTQTKYSIIHFFHPDFRRCQIMDNHLEVLARKHFDTLIAKANVEKCPFLVEKLNVQVLPCVISFIDGKSVGRMVGFEELGNTDSFQTSLLERHLLNLGVFQRAKTTESTNVNSSIKNLANTADSDDDWDD